MTQLTVALAQRGQVTIPKTLREQHQWDTGQQFSVLDLDGVVIMTPRKSKVDTLVNQLRDDLLSEGATLETMLTELRQLRETHGRKRE